MVNKQISKPNRILFVYKNGKNNIAFFIVLNIFVLILLAFYSSGVLAKFSLFGIKEIADVPSSGANCWRYMGNFSGCAAANSTCSWGNNSGAILQDPWCSFNSTNYNSTTETMWIGTGFLPYNNITGGFIYNAGCCMEKIGSGGGGQQTGCWSFDGNKTGCLNSTNYGVSGCNWKPNGANQNPMCYVKQIGDWASGHQVNNVNDIGCCEKAGCWSYNGNQASFGANNCTNVLGGVCTYVAGGSMGCPDSGGCCWPKSCSEVSTQTACEQLSQLDMPCVWNQSSSNACEMRSGGGFNMYNDTDSCMSQGGWWNSTGSCVMPGTSGSGSMGGGGGFMFAQEARCWFADQRASVCNNVTGCVYCSSASAQINNASSACYQAPSGACKGHEPLSNDIIDINKTSMTCNDIRFKQTCLCGPLPNCVWTNSSTSVGPIGTNYCIAGIKTSDQMQLCIPPAQYCEDPKAKNNQTMCNDLATNYMMPCKWDNSTTPAKNCTFNSIAVFGGGAGSGSMDYNLISGETSCVAAGGTWMEEYYIDSDGSFKQDGWCEKGAMFNFATGQAFGNKGNCDVDCWACEFNSTGSNYGGNLTLAQATCLGSAKGICRWRNDTNAPNQLGWCDYPQEMSFGGAKDCNSDCKACEYFQNPRQACSGSPVGCLWTNDSNAMNGQGGYCISSSKKSCISDCFSCYGQSECSNSSFHANLNCSWDQSFNFCKPTSFTGEICFNGKDDDSDQIIDCADSDCTYDQFCGGASIGGSGGIDCKKENVEASCRAGVAASGKNCTWVTPSFGGSSYCDFPGSNCWMYESNTSGCTTGIGCYLRNITNGFTGFCKVNETTAQECFNNYSLNSNATLCNANSKCEWINDSFMGGIGGRCEFKLFSSCNRITSSASCTGNCTWRTDSFSMGGGFCEPICFSLNNNTCNNPGSGLCSYVETACEPETFYSYGGGGGGGGVGFGCHMYDSNYTRCFQQNMTCSWVNFTGGSGSQGACESKGDRMIIAGMDQSPPKILGSDDTDTTPLEIDIKQYGVKDMIGSLGFGIMVTNITNAAVCKGYMVGGMGSGPMMGSSTIGNGTTTTKYYWYLDTNKNTTDGCNGVFNSTTNSTGYEFLIKYVITLNNISASETKSFYTCSSGSWSLTNIPLTSNRQFMCSMSMPFESMIGGVMILVDKENLESFTTYNKTVAMRVLVTSANETYNENNPLDWVSTPGYYTPGSADFKFIDCGNPTNKNDDKCKNFNKFGFNIFEDCKNGMDDDSDGMADCADPKCIFTPICAGSSAFSFEANANDKEAPSVVFSNVDTLHNSAFIKFDSNEPANGSLTFYSNDSSCLTVNRTIAEVGDLNIAFDDYKPFHMVPLDDTTLPGFTSGLTNGTTYYYKNSICDPSGNCAESACQNFTTKSDNAYKNFIFKMKLPAGFNVTIPSLGYSGNFTTTVGSRVYETGIKTNASVTKNINVTINCGNQSITLVGVDIFKPKSIDMSGAFICDSNSTSSTLGMNSSSKAWNQVVSDLSMGGSGDYIEITLPVTYSSSNNITWCNDDLTNCTRVNNYANCSSGGTGKTNCNVPTSLGFSVYNIATVTTVTSTTTTSSSGGGGGGGGAITKKNTTATATPTPSGTATPTPSGIPEQTLPETTTTGFGAVFWIVAVIIVIFGVIGMLIGLRSAKRKKRGY